MGLFGNKAKEDSAILDEIDTSVKETRKETEAKEAKIKDQVKVPLIEKMQKEFNDIKIQEEPQITEQGTSESVLSAAVNLEAKENPEDIAAINEARKIDNSYKLFMQARNGEQHRIDEAR